MLPLNPKTLALAAALLALPAAQADTTIFFEDFSTAVGAPNGFPYGDGYGKGYDILGTQFTVTAGNVDIVGLPSGAPWSCGDGNNCLDLVGAGAQGAIASKPSFDLQSGSVYTISFKAAAGGGNAFVVALGGFSAQVSAPADFTTFTFSYAPTVAEAGTRLSFTSLYGYSSVNGASIDDVLVTATPVPEPGAWALFGAGLLLVGHRARRGRARA